MMAQEPRLTETPLKLTVATDKLAISRRGKSGAGLNHGLKTVSCGHDWPDGQSALTAFPFDQHVAISADSALGCLVSLTVQPLLLQVEATQVSRTRSGVHASDWIWQPHSELSLTVSLAISGSFLPE